MAKSKNRITAKQIDGNDGYCWAVLIDGRVFVCGLTKREVPYYKKVAAEALGIETVKKSKDSAQ